jgi:energy-coupling factor transport system ATP-binding protein
VRKAARFVDIAGEASRPIAVELSGRGGGQKRRAAIAGVIAMMPEVLILDEPTAA